MITLDDVAAKDGPYWAAYQAERERCGITDGPDTVPYWFLAKTARERVSAARVALAQLPPAVGVKGTWAAIWRLENALRGSVETPHGAAVVAALLGAHEIESDRERAETAARNAEWMRS